MSLAVAAVVKWEWSWLIEWIEYHKLVGVDHFYIYSNEEAREHELTKMILSRYFKNGLVDVFHWPGEAPQMNVYKDALRLAKGHFRWLACIDLDEFIYPIKKDTITEVLKEFEEFDGLGVTWKIYGTGGNLWRPKSQINDLLWRSSQVDGPNAHIKSIVNPAVATHFLDPHRANVYTVDEVKRHIAGAFAWLTPQKIRINHYALRSAEDYWHTKIMRGRADIRVDKGLDFFEEHDMNDVYDDGIARRFGRLLRTN